MKEFYIKLFSRLILLDINAFSITYKCHFFNCGFYNTVVTIIMVPNGFKLSKN